MEVRFNEFFRGAALDGCRRSVQAQKLGKLAFIVARDARGFTRRRRRYNELRPRPSTRTRTRQGRGDLRGYAVEIGFRRQIDARKRFGLSVDGEGNGACLDLRKGIHILL